MMNRSVTRCLLGEEGWRGRITPWISHSHFSKTLPQTLTPSREIMSNEMLPRAVLSCSAITGQGKRPPIDGGSNCRERRARGISANASLTFFFLEICHFLPLGQKTHRSKWVLRAGAVSTVGAVSSTFPAVRALGQVCREKASMWGLEETCRA